jgi:hypothetical protein
MDLSKLKSSMLLLLLISEMMEEEFTIYLLNTQTKIQLSLEALPLLSLKIDA